MNQNEVLIEDFYAAFSAQNANGMQLCYHKNIVFQDPAFGILKEIHVINMWKMLINKSKGNLKIEFFDIKANENYGTAKWIGTYNFSKTNRKVINEITATFEFKEGLIIRHTDTFDLWKWSQQAFGWKGFLLGWTGFLQSKIQQQAKLSLKLYENKV